MGIFVSFSSRVVTNFFGLDVSTDVSVGCCYATYGFGRFDVSVASGLSVAVPERFNGVFSSKVDLQPEISRFPYFRFFFIGTGFVPPVFCSREAAGSLIGSKVALFCSLVCFPTCLWVDKQFLAFCHFCSCCCCCCCCCCHCCCQVFLLH